MRSDQTRAPLRASMPAGPASALTPRFSQALTRLLIVVQARDYAGLQRSSGVMPVPAVLSSVKFEMETAIICLCTSSALSGAFENRTREPQL